MIAVDLPEYRQKHIARLWFKSKKSAQTIASELAVTPAQVFAVINNELSIGLDRLQFIIHTAAIHNARFKAKPNTEHKK